MNTIDIVDYGAIGDGKTLNTQKIQDAIDACHVSGGGRVIISDGVFITGTIKLYSNIDLHICANAVLQASVDGDDYPDFDCKEWDKKKAPRATSRCLIYVGYANNITISGMGKIDCMGSYFCDQQTDINGVNRYVRKTDILPARMIFIMGCTNVSLKDFTMHEMAGGWGCWINHSQYVSVDKIKMVCNPQYPNADGVHINCSSDVTVSNCTIHSGDDSIIVRANSNTLDQPCPCERVIVTGCILSSNHNAIRIGWRNDGVIRNCVFSDLVITDSRQGINIELPCRSNPTDVGKQHTHIRNVRFNNIAMDRIDEVPVVIRIYPDNLVEIIENITFSNISSNSGKFPLIQGRQDSKVKNIVFSNCQFDIAGNCQDQLPLFVYALNVQLNDTVFNVG